MGPAGWGGAAVRVARDDLLAWIGGGMVWALVMAWAQGVPDGVAFGAALSVILRRALGLILDL